MKKKIFAIVLCICMLAIAIVSGTMAYFTDTHEQTNTFTAGKVGIYLDETEIAVDGNGAPLIGEDGNLTITGERTDASQTYKLFPGMIVPKDPTITLDADSEDAYVAAIITVKFEAPEVENEDGTVTKMSAADVVAKLSEEKMGLHHPTWPMLNVEKFLTGDYIGPVPPKADHPLKHSAGQVYGNDDYSVFQIGKDDELTYTIYMFFEDKQSADDAITLFDTMKIPAAWDNAEMAIMNGMEINVKAYAVQANGFTGTYPCYAAMVAAFGQNAGDPFKF